MASGIIVQTSVYGRQDNSYGYDRFPQPLSSVDSAYSPPQTLPLIFDLLVDILHLGWCQDLPHLLPTSRGKDSDIHWFHPGQGGLIRRMDIPTWTTLILTYPEIPIHCDGWDLLLKPLFMTDRARGGAQVYENDYSAKRIRWEGKNRRFSPLRPVFTPIQLIERREAAEKCWKTLGRY